MRRAVGRARSPRRRGSARAPAARRTASTISGAAGGDVVAVARVDAHVVAGLVDLHARAVELPLERRRRRARAARRRRRRPAARASARAAATARGAKRLKAGRAFGQRGARDARRSRRRPSPLGARATRGSDGRRRDRVDHHAFERALAQLAEQQPREEVAARARSRARTARTGARCARPSSPPPAIDAICVERASTSMSVERRGVAIRRRRLRVAHQRVADAASSLPGLAREIGDADLDFRRARACARQSASTAVLALRLAVSATRRDVSTSSASSVIRPSYGRTRGQREGGEGGRMKEEGRKERGAGRRMGRVGGERGRGKRGGGLE